MSSTGRDESAARRTAAIDTYASNVTARRDRGLGAIADRYIHFGHWDESPALDRATAEFPAAQERYNEQILALASLGDGQDVLDAGCGFGGTLGALDARWKEMRLVGLNLDPRQLAVAAAGIHAHDTNTLTWIEGDASTLSAFGAETFDRVLAVESILHFASRRHFLAHAARILRPTGRLALSDLVATPELRALRLAGGIPFDVDRLLASGLAPWPDFWCEDADYEQLAVAAGLRVAGWIDATIQTLPSYRAILGPVDEEADRSQREGMRLLEWLQSRGLLRVVYAAFEKP